MSLDLFQRILEWSRRRHGIGEVALLGGEPSLHPNFAKMVVMAHDNMEVRVVTNGTRRFRQLISCWKIYAEQLSRVAVSLDSLDEQLQANLRGPWAWHDAMETISLLRANDIQFDINITALKPVLDGLELLIEFASEAGCRRVNIHWPSAIGLGSGLVSNQMPGRDEWIDLVRRVRDRTKTRPGFFVEIERGFLTGEEQLIGCALPDCSNLQIFPDGRAYRCGLLVDRPDMASLCMTGDDLIVTQRESGENLLAASMTRPCDSCPAVASQERRACIYDKVSSAPAVTEYQAAAVDLVIFDALNTLVTAHPDYRNTFLDGLVQAGLEPSWPLLAEFQAASEGIDHSPWSRSRDSYVAWAADTLGLANQPNHRRHTGDTARILTGRRLRWGTRPLPGGGRTASDRHLTPPVRPADHRQRLPAGWSGDLPAQVSATASAHASYS
jgi:MoaA/NifB/PqqE/SkfB family radical SAM enzyme